MKDSGYIYSIETLGALDGPGIRTIIFLQGCPLRCAYCHNPDSWEKSSGKLYSVTQLIGKITRYIPYYKEHGGVTLSGGEPLMQADFASALLKACKDLQISTTLDTSGALFSGSVKELLKYTDLVIADVKGLNEKDFRQNCGGSYKTWLKFIEYCAKTNKRVWLRLVVIDGPDDLPSQVRELSNLAKKYSNIEKVELLPYHHEGAIKWKLLGKPYPLTEKQIPSEKLMNYLRSLV